VFATETAPIGVATSLLICVSIISLNHSISLRKPGNILTTDCENTYKHRQRNGRDNDIWEINVSGGAQHSDVLENCDGYEHGPYVFSVLSV
jgi:hypothetical protein